MVNVSRVFRLCLFLTVLCFCIFSFGCLCLFVYLFVWVFVFVCVFVCLGVCVCLCIFLFGCLGLAVRFCLFLTRWWRFAFDLELALVILV